jgi:uncharacterized protein
MLQRTFLHIPGVGEITERRIWAAGIRSWADFMAAHERGVLRATVADLRREVEDSAARYAEGDWNFFERNVPSLHKWRAYGDLGERALYVDIETTGMGADAAITVVGTYDGVSAKSFVAGENLQDALEELESHPLLVTYNGAQFDLPAIRRHFRHAFPKHIHVDLRFPLRRLGYSGGLKKIEEAFGIERSARTRGLDGWDAVRLWHEYQRGHAGALDLLLEYNREDIRNLEPLMQFVFREMSGALNAGVPTSGPRMLGQQPLLESSDPA